MSRNEAIRAAVAAGARITDVARDHQISRQRAEQIVHFERHSARAALHYALDTGRLRRPSECQNSAQHRRPIEAHHADYSRPLDVQWLCRRCHLRAEIAKRHDALTARRAEQERKREMDRRARRESARVRAAAFRHERGRRALAVLRQLVQARRRVPSYWELVSALLGRDVPRNSACWQLSNYLDWRHRPRKWIRVRALYRLAGIKPRAAGEPGHIPSRNKPAR